MTEAEKNTEAEDRPRKNVVVDDSFSDFNYWRTPIPTLDLDDL